MSTKHVLGATILAALGGWAVAYRLGQTWGTTTAEREMQLPGDALVSRPAMGGDHAITIDAMPSDVWPWLVQMGWHRGGWYTYRWVDTLLFPMNGPSAETVIPELQDLHVGDRIPDGPPELGCFFVVEELAEARHLVLRSTTHLPPQLMQRPDVAMSWTWTFALAPTPDGRTRFHFRWRGEARPWWLRLTYKALVTPLDFLMGRSMCLGLKRRVERELSHSTVRRVAAS